MAITELDVLIMIGLMQITDLRSTDMADFLFAIKCTGTHISTSNNRSIVLDVVCVHSKFVKIMFIFCLF